MFEARTNEIDALSKAKSVLSGADYSLLQKDSSATTLLARGRGTPTDTLLPVGEGAYQSAEAVQQRTTDHRKICEDAKAKGDYSDKLWTECFKVGGDYTDVRPVVAAADSEAARAAAAAAAAAAEARLKRSGASPRSLSGFVLVAVATVLLQN